jgi:ABC-type transport system involved in cytochrome bd biosynthesis fused ATPase/permease subunit
MAGRAQGLISVKSIAKDFTRAACCEQTPWLPDDTIQNVIVGAERLDRAWLSRVLSMCCLATDIERLEKGVNTLVGANGAGLSGGQKKRVVSRHWTIFLSAWLDYGWSVLIETGVGKSYLLA